ncbi:MAG: TonB-dependent receptor [Gammaproteobacteria bacterium]|nr:TonB-dependent receptor [Gammaproteobacteria bacterium]
MNPRVLTVETMPVRHRGMLVASLLGTLSPTPAAAEGIEEIIVTAQRLPTELQDTALSVSVLTGERLHRSAARDITDWFALVPGLNYADDGFGGHITKIRGVSNGSSFEPRPLSIWYFDDVPIITVSGAPYSSGQLGGPHPQAIDLARIEVLRGPQGTLFGSNALGGAIRLITNQPELGAFSATIEGAYSTTAHGGNNYAGSVILNVPFIGDKAALRFVGYHLGDGGFIDNEIRGISDVDAVEINGGRVSLRWQPIAQFELNLLAFGQERTSEGLRDRDVNAGPFGQRRAMPEHDDESWQMHLLTLDYDFPWAHLVSRTSYSDRQPEMTYDISNYLDQNLGLPLEGASVFDDSIRQFVQELRLTAPSGGPLWWVAGAYYQEEDRGFDVLWIVPGFIPPDGGEIFLFYGVESWLRQRALYGEIAYDIANNWRAVVGARWFEFKEETQVDSAGYVFGVSAVSQSSYRESGVTPRASLEYRPNDRMLLFATASQGFRPGGTNPLTAGVKELCAQDLESLNLDVGFESDSLWNFEIGARTRWLDDRLSLSGTLFHIDWKDMQTFLMLPNCAAVLIENVGSATSDGIELELTFLPLPRFELGLTAAYIDPRLDQDMPNLGGEKNQRIPGVPPWTVSLYARRDFELSGGFGAFLQAEHQYIDGFWNRYARETRTKVPARNNVNVRAGVRVSRLELELFAENLLDERGVLAHSLDFIGEWEVLTRPRTVGVRARVEF